MEDNSPSQLNSPESLTARSVNLRLEAIKFVEEGAKSVQLYNVSMDALQEATKKVVASKRKSSGVTNAIEEATVSSQEMHLVKDNQAADTGSLEEKRKKIRQLTADLESTNKRCEVYRANLLALLREMEDQKLKLSVKVHNAWLGLKE